MAESSMQIAVATAAAVVGVLLGGADCCGVNGRGRGPSSASKECSGAK